MGAFRFSCHTSIHGTERQRRHTEHAGLYLLHCHNLEHEDAGMMLNLEVS